MKLQNLLFITSAIGHSIPNVHRISKIVARDELAEINSIYDSLSSNDLDYINKHVDNLKNFDGSDCDACKNKMSYARGLIDDDEDAQHLISLTLFKYCLELNDNDPTACEKTDFFITTQSKYADNSYGVFDSAFPSGGALDMFDNDFIQVLKKFNTSNDLDLEYYCYYKGDGACDLPEAPKVEDLMDFDSLWPEKESKHHFPPDFSNADRSLFNVLHISDFHTQLRYTVGAEGQCDQSLCCLPESFTELVDDDEKYNFTTQYLTYVPDLDVSSINLSFYPDAHYDENNNYVSGDSEDLTSSKGWNFAIEPASTFGSFLCDSPIVLVNNTLKQIAKTLDDKKFKFTLFTGDLVDHDKIHANPETTMDAEKLGFGMIKHFLGGIPVYSAMGNHDTFPYGQLAPEKYDTINAYSYNSKLMSDLWVGDGWLPEEDRQEIKSHYSGFSTVTKEGLKIIVLNSNAYYQNNLWAYINMATDLDPFGNWEFLINELVESEKNNQRVWIMSHISSSDEDALPIQSQIFSKIVERFSPYTIANIFYGHTHRDQFKIFFSSNSTSAEDVEREVINMAYLAPSVTPRKNYNPSYKYYEIENSTFNVINSYTYYADLDETYVSGGKEPVWDHFYSAREIYDEDGEWPSDAPLNGTFWNEFVLKKLTDDDIDFNQKYIDYQYRNTPTKPDCTSKKGKLKDKCKKKNYCEANFDLSEDYLRCIEEVDNS